MQKRIIILKRGIEKKELIESLCCPGPVIPLRS
jgi:hypothetical protein